MVWVEKSPDQQEIALGVFLDIEEAFNNTSYDSTCAALAKTWSRAHHRMVEQNHPEGSAGHGDSWWTFQERRGV